MRRLRALWEPLDGFERGLLVWGLCMFVLTVKLYADQVVYPTCEACNLPDLSWYIQLWCWANC